MSQQLAAKALAILKMYAKKNPNIRLGNVKEIMTELQGYPKKTLESII